VAVSGDGDEAFRAATEQRFNLTILDVTLPARTVSICAVWFRERAFNGAIPMLTARAQVDHRGHRRFRIAGEIDIKYHGTHAV
jgi:DNA-binding response OmpR family regulator